MKTMHVVATAGLVLIAVVAGCAVAAQPDALPQVPASNSDMTVAPPVEAPQSPSVPAGAASEPAMEEEETGPIAPVALDVALVGDRAVIPLAAIEDAVNGGFSVTAGDRALDFMAYEPGGEVFVRVSACPPCFSRSFELDGETLVCQACATRFDAWTGGSIEGACVDYAKASVAYDVSDGLVTMSVGDLARAYDETLAPGAESLVEEEVAAEAPQEEVDTRPSCCRERLPAR